MQMKTKFKVKGKRFARPFYMKYSEIIPTLMTLSQIYSVLSRFRKPLKFKKGGCFSPLSSEIGEEYIILLDGSKAKAPN